MANKWNADERRWIDTDEESRPITQELRQKRIGWARILLRNAQNETSRQLALKLARRWGLNALELG